MKTVYLLIGIIIFAFVAILFWLAGNRLPNSIILQLDYAGIVLGYLLSCLTITIALIAWVKRQDIRRWLRRSHFESVGAPFDVPEKKVVATVIPVSPRRQQPEWILLWLKPKHVSFLYTDRSREIAAELAETFSRSPYNMKFFPSSSDIKKGKFKLHDVDDPEESKSLVRDFLRRFLENATAREEIFVDTTAGKVPMSIGAFQSAEEMGISSIYVVGTVNGWIEEPKQREHGRPVFMSDHTGKS